MGRPGRVVWSEGMALDPQHFQQWDRYHQAELQSRLRSVAPHAWGFTDLQTDATAIANGTFRLTRCAGVLADGLPFAIPESDPQPAARQIAEHFPPREERLAVFLAVPLDREDGVNFSLGTDRTQRDTRFVVNSLSIVDETNGHAPRPIDVARPNFSLKFASESMAGFATLKIAEIVRSQGREFAFDEQFVPTCLSIGASSALRTMTRRLLESLVTKSASLWERTRRLPLGQAALSAGDVVSLLLQQTTNAFIPILGHYDASLTQHPEALYTTLVTLAGQLSAMPGHADHPRSLPSYDHEDPTAAFTILNTTITRLLGPGRDPEVNYLSIELVRREDLNVGQITEPALIDDGIFYLIARGAPAGSERTLPGQLRVAAPTAMAAVRNSFLRALPIEWEPRPPTGAPAGPDLQYFRLVKDPDFWNQIRSDGAVAIHVPPHVNGLSIQLIAVRPGHGT